MRSLIPFFLAAAAVASTAPARAEFMDLMARQDDVGELKAPRFGASRLLVIPVEVKGTGLAPLPHDRLVQFFETQSDVDFRFRSYFERASAALFTPEVEVAPTVVFDGCPQELGDCASAGSGLSGLTGLKGSVGLLRQVFSRAHAGCFAGPANCDATRSIDFSEFDVNGPFQRADGYVDGVMVVTNLKGVIASLPLARLNDAGPNDLAEGRGGPFILNDTKVPLVSVCGAGSAAGALPEYGCVKQFGHQLGLADMAQSDTWAAAHPGLGYPGLELSAMGDWSYDASAPMPDAESRFRLGWAAVQVVSGTRTITLAPAAAGGGVVKLGQATPERPEYWLVEARGPVGPYDRDVVRKGDRAPVHGLAVYHVDWSKGPTGEPGTYIKQLMACLNCDPWRPLVMNVQADGRFDLQQGLGFHPEDDLFRTGSRFGPAASAAPFTAEAPAWGANYYDGTPAGIRIDNVLVDAQTGTVTADFTAPAVTDACADVRCAPAQECAEGNCSPPAESKPPANAPALPAARTEPPSDGWGCTSAGGPAIAAITALLARRRRRLTLSA